MATDKVKLGPNGKPLRPFVMPQSLAGKIRVWRYLWMRRVVQISVLILFFGSAHWEWNFHKQPIISGDLSSSTLLDTVPLADPFAVLQILASGHTVLSKVLIGSLIILSFYLIVGGRVWCSWVCPVNLISDLANRLRKTLQIKNAFQLSRKFRYSMLALSLVLSAISGVAAFEWISPIGIFHREVIFGLGGGWLILLGLFIFDSLVLKDGWCGHLCPLGAFYAVVGKVSLLRIAFNTPTCTHCVECVKVCPEPQVLNLKRASEKGYISSGECTNCGRCITVCPEHTLKFDLQLWIKRAAAAPGAGSQQNSRKIDDTDHRRKAA